MKRILIITVLAVLLTSTAGATAAIAAPTGNAAVRQFDVAIDNSDGTTSTGKLTINPAEQTFVFNGAGWMPGTMYYLSMGFNDGTFPGWGMDLGATAAKADGSIHMTGQCTATTTQLDTQSPRVNIGPRVQSGPGYYHGYWGVNSFILQNHGAFVAKIACYYSTDEGVTWHESDKSAGILAGRERLSGLDCLGVPDHALVKLHAVVVGGKDKTYSEVYRYEPYVLGLGSAPSFIISGTTLINKLTFDFYDQAIDSC